jgi:hypothetical protein
MQAFMPGTQPRGTHSFNPGSSSSVSATQALDKVNAEEDGEEDRAGPPVDTPAANIPAAFTSAMSSLFPHDPSAASFAGTPRSDALPPPPSMASFAGTPRSDALPPPPSMASFAGTPRSDAPPPPPSTASFAGTPQSDALPPPSSSSVSPTTHPDHVSRSQHVSVDSAFSCTTASETSSSQRKRKRDATVGMPPPSSKRASKNRTETLNPVIISSQLNSTLTRLADVMEKSLDVTATSIEVTTQPAPSPSPQALSMPSQLLGPQSTLSSTSLSDSEILDKALGIVTAAADKDFLSEDDLLAASLLFSNTSNELVRIARTFIALGDKPAVQHRFLMRQLEDAGFHTGKGKGKATTNDDDDFLMSC